MCLESIKAANRVFFIYYFQTSEVKLQESVFLFIESTENKLSTKL